MVKEKVAVVYRSLRRTILGAMNKSEALNGFLKWLFFGGQGIIAENRRDEQRKIIKYNYLFGNLVIFHNVIHMIKILHQLTAEEHRINPEAPSVVRPYLLSHINRFGHFPLNTERIPDPVEYTLPASLSLPVVRAVK